MNKRTWKAKKALMRTCIETEFGFFETSPQTQPHSGIGNKDGGQREGRLEQQRKPRERENEKTRRQQKTEADKTHYSPLGTPNLSTPAHTRASHSPHTLCSWACSSPSPSPSWHALSVCLKPGQHALQVVATPVALHAHLLHQHLLRQRVDVVLVRFQRPLANARKCIGKAKNGRGRR